MTDPMFFLETLPDPLPGLGDTVELTGEEGRHAAVVRRIRPGEAVLLADGRGRGVRGTVLDTTRSGLRVEVLEHRYAPAPPLRFVAAQALAKGDRSELAVEMLTEVGVDEILPWQASRSVVRWSGERGEKSLGKWRSTAREAAKQSRRLRVPDLAEPVHTAQLCRVAAEADLALVLHEEAGRRLPEVPLPEAGTVLVVIGPEGGITEDEVSGLSAAGAVPVSISDGVLRTSTAGVVALAGLLLR